LGYYVVKKNIVLSRFDRIPVRDGRTDGQTDEDGQADIIAISISRVSVLYDARQWQSYCN